MSSSKKRARELKDKEDTVRFFPFTAGPTPFCPNFSASLPSHTHTHFPRCSHLPPLCARPWRAAPARA
jgi:hypothetical protein